MSALGVVFFVLVPPLILALVLYLLRDEFAAAWRPIVLIALASVAFFHRMVFFGEALSQADANLLQLQFFTVYRTAILDFAEIPFWNPYIGAGVTNLANPLSALFYPLAPVFLVADVFRAMGIVVVCHYFLAGVFALFLARRMFRNGPAALAFALLYAFNGWAVTRAAHQPAIEYLFAYTWLPLAALAFERVIDGKSIFSSIVVAGAALAWMGMACPNLFVYGIVFLSAAFVLRVIHLLVSGRRHACTAGISVAIGAVIFAAALGMVEYGPARELAQLSTAGRLGTRQPSGWRTEGLPLWTIVKLYFPYTTGRPFGAYYSLGVLALVPALFSFYAALRFRFRRVFVIAAAALLALGVALVAKSPLYAALMRLSETIALSSLMPASLIFLVLPIALLAALGIEALIEEYKRLSGPRAWLLPALIFIELFAGLGIVYPRWGDRRLTFDYAGEVADFPHLDALSSEGDAGRILVQSPSEGQVLAPSYAVLSRGLSRVNPHLSDFAPDWLARALAGVELDPKALDALGVGWVVSTDPLPLPAPPIVIQWPSVESHLEENIFFPLRHQAAWAAWNRSVYLYHTSLIPSVVRAEPLTKQSIIQGRSKDPLSSMNASNLNQFADWAAMPIVSQTTNSLAVLLPEGAPSRYFLALTAYPGWRAFADGREIPWAVAAGAFIATDVPQNSSLLELRFRPAHWGLYVGLACVAFLIAVVAAARESKAVSPLRTPLSR